MKPFMVYDPSLNVNVNIYYSTNEESSVQVISKNNECFVFPENIIKKNVEKNNLKLLNVDEFGILNSHYVMDIFKHYKKKTYE